MTGNALAVVEWSDGIVTAVRDRASGDLLLHAWKVGVDGSIAQKGTATAGPIDDVSAVALSETRLVTVQKLAKSHELEAIVWDLSDGGATITRRGSIVAPPPAAIHAGAAVCNLFADIQITTEIAPAQVAVAAREANGHLKVTLWDVNAHGDFVLKSDAAFDPVDEIAMTFAGSGSRQTTEGEKTPTSQALVAARRADGDLGLFLLVAANDDVLPDIPSWASVDFTMQHQQQSKWCWAATSTSVAHFFKPSTGWTQCKVANHIKGRTDCCGSGASGPCNDGDFAGGCAERRRPSQLRRRGCGVVRQRARGDRSGVARARANGVERRRRPLHRNRRLRGGRGAAADDRRSHFRRVRLGLPDVQDRVSPFRHLDRYLLRETLGRCRFSPARRRPRRSKPFRPGHAPCSRPAVPVLLHCGPPMRQL